MTLRYPAGPSRGVDPRHKRPPRRTAKIRPEGRHQDQPGRQKTEETD